MQTEKQNFFGKQPRLHQQGGNPNQIREFKEQIGRIFSVDFNPKGNLGFSGSSLDGKGEVRCFEIDSGKQLWSKLFDQSPVYAVRTLPNGQELAVAGYDGKTRFLAVASGELKREMSIAPLVKDNAKGSSFELNKNFASVELLAAESLPESTKVIGLSIEPQKVS